MPQSTAQQLVQLIIQAVTDIETDIATRIPGGVMIDANSPQVAPIEGLEITPERRNALRTLKAATHQLLATLMPAGSQVAEIQQSALQTAALQTVLQARIADLIHSFDPELKQAGVHIDLLAKSARMDTQKLQHILRFLALRNVFCEIRPNHWVNTRCSVPLRTDSPNTLWNCLSFIGEDVALPALSELPSVLLDDQNGGAFSWDQSQTAFRKYRKFDGDFFQFLAMSENGYRAERFGKAMTESTKMNGNDVALRGYDWKKFGTKGTLIDVGGGIGVVAYSLASYLPGWKVVVQDRPEVVKMGQENYQKIGSTANVEFEEVDFFREQPVHRVGETDVYFLQQILHDWPLESCVQILTNLRRAAKPTTRLLICEINLEPPILDPNSPILSNGGMAMVQAYGIDLTMLTFYNSLERSEEEYKDILNKGGWLFQSVTALATWTDVAVFEGAPDLTWRDKP